MKGGDVVAKKAYIAGKITGNPNFREEFQKATDALVKKGFAVMDPSGMMSGFEQSEYHSVCMSMIDICDVVYFLPNWVDSKGSHLEMGYAKGCKKEIKFVEGLL